MCASVCLFFFRFFSFHKFRFVMFESEFLLSLFLVCYLNTHRKTVRQVNDAWTIPFSCPTSLILFFLSFSSSLQKHTHLLSETHRNRFNIWNNINLLFYKKNNIRCDEEGQRKGTWVLFVYMYVWRNMSNESNRVQFRWKYTQVMRFHFITLLFLFLYR